MKIVVAGGGTAGWMTALYANKIYPEADITLVESEDIGILGAGEGSVPIFTFMLTALGIAEDELIKETNATFKIGIHFQNWKADGSSYFHPFILEDNKNTKAAGLYKHGDTITIGLPEIGTNYPLINFISNQKNLDEWLLTNRLAYSNKGPYGVSDNKLIRLNQYSYHFDAHLLAKFLRKKAEERGVKRVVGDIVSVTKNNLNDITSLNLKDNSSIDLDFVFDCTGFKRLIIGRVLKSNWVSYRNKLLVDTALPFFLEQESDYIKPYTEAIAMDYGWMWRIPLQNRYGCGYIFDSSYISSEDAKKEIEKFVGKEVKINKEIKFHAGRFEKLWINNCVSIGLASGFTEPIEATAIWTIIVQLMRLSKQAIIDTNEQFRDEYNSYMAIFNDSISDFLQFHYFTNKTNTPFWSEYKNRITISDSINKRINAWKFRTPNEYDKNENDTFDTISWNLVALGISDDMISNEIIKKENSIYNLDTKLKSWLLDYQKDLEFYDSSSFDHKEFLKMVTDGKIQFYYK